MSLLLPSRSEASCSEAQISIAPVWEALARHGGSPLHHSDMDSPKEMLRLENGKLVKQCELLFSQMSDLQEQLRGAQKAAAVAEERCKHQANLTAAEREKFALVQAECADMRRQLAASSPKTGHDASTGSGGICAQDASNESERLLAEQVHDLRAQLLLRPSLQEHDALSSEVDRLRRELATQGEMRAELQTLREDLATKQDEIQGLRSQLVARPSVEEHLSVLQEVGALKEQLQAVQMGMSRNAHPPSPLLSSRIPESAQTVPVFYASHSVPRQRPVVTNLVTPRSPAPPQATTVLSGQTASCSQPKSHVHPTSGRPSLAVTAASRELPRSSAGVVSLETPRGGQRAWSGQLVPNLDLSGCLSARAQSPKPSSVSLRSPMGRAPAGYVTTAINGRSSTPQASDNVYSGHARRPIQVARPPSSAWE